MEKKSFWKHQVLWPLLRYFHLIKDLPMEIKWRMQRSRRGWADCDAWNMNSYVARVIPQMLRELAKNPQGCPEKFMENDSCEKWSDKLNEIATGLEAYNDIDGFDFTNARWRELHTKRDLDWEFIPCEDRNFTQLKLISHLDEQEEAEYQALTTMLRKDALNKWHKAMADYAQIYPYLWD